jgi:hypothetical protein
MNPSIFNPKQAVENFVEKITLPQMALTALGPARNAAPV